MAAKKRMVICGSSYADLTKTKVIDRVVRYTHIVGAPISYLPNEDGKLIDTGQIIIAMKLLECKNDIFVMMVSWEHCVTSEDRYRLICDTDHEIGGDQEERTSQSTSTSNLLGFEYRSVHDGDRRGFTVKPTSKYFDDIVQLQHAKAVMTPLTEQKSLNLHDETTACDQVQHSLFKAVFGKLQYITGVTPDVMFATKCLSYKLASPTLADSTRAKKVLRSERNTRN